MQPLNTTERRSAFLNFIIFFAVTIALILVTAFFSVQVPFKDNARLREVNKVSESEQAFMDRFQGKLGVALQKLEGVNKEEFSTTAESIDSEIQGSIGDMSTMVANDSVANKDFYRNVIAALSSSRIAKKELRDIRSKSVDASEWKEKYDRLDQDFRNYRDEVLRSRQVAH